MPAFALGLYNTLIDADIPLSSCSASPSPQTNSTCLSDAFQAFKTFVFKLSEIDWLGTAFVTATALCIQMVFSYGAPMYGWTSWITVAFVGTSVSLLLMVLLVSRLHTKEMR